MNYLPKLKAGSNQMLMEVLFVTMTTVNGMQLWKELALQYCPLYERKDSITASLLSEDSEVSLVENFFR